MGRVPDDLAAAMSLGSEMGQRIAEFDWEAHPLGALETWPARMRSTVAATLASRFPTVLWFGRDLFLIYNDAYLPMLGDKHPGSLGARGQDVWSEIWDVIGPMLNGVMDTGVATWSADQRLRIRRHDYLEDAFFTFTYSPMFGDSGEVTGVFCAVNETSEKVVGERRLQTLNELAARVIECHEVETVAATALATCESNRIDLPFAALYLRDGDSSSLYGATATVARVFAAGAASLDALLDGAAVEARGTLVERCEKRVSGLGEALGESATLSALVLPLDDSLDGPPKGSLLVGLNPRLTFDQPYRAFCELVAACIGRAFASAGLYALERERAEALSELDRAKSVFFSNASHEFRTPLTLMLGPLEDAIGAAENEPVLTEQLETVYRNSQRLLRLVNSLLDFARIEAGEARPEFELVDVGAITAELAGSFRELCTRAGIELILDCEPVVGSIDTGMWETILLNLLSNAFKFTLEGTITVSVHGVEPATIEVLVMDTGVGIAAADLDRLFERFYRPESAQGRSTEGSGIGLALVRDLIELNGGTISIASESGTGTTVAVRLPAAEVSVPSDSGRSRVRPTSANLYVTEASLWLGEETAPPTNGDAPDRPLILIADDNADMRRYLQRVLRPRWNTITVGDGAQALEFARRTPPDLVVTDVMMPTLDGLGLVGAMRSDPQLASVPVIMLSARAGDEAAGEGLAAGADDYLVKPFTSTDLLNRVGARLELAARAQASTDHDRLIAKQAAGLAELGAALGAARSVGEALEPVLEFVLRRLGANTAAIGVVDHDRSVLEMRYAGGLPTQLRDRYHLVALDAPVPIADVIRQEQALYISDVRDLDARYVVVVSDVSTTVGASAIEPLRGAGGAVIGAFSVAWPEPHEFDSSERELLGQLAELLAPAVVRIDVSEQEHRIATALQERLLDLEVRSSAAVISAMYQPAGELVRVGGDWYTATTLDQGEVAISVGDVVGHGLEGATVMSQLRSALDTAALTATEPTPVIDLLERYARRVPGAHCATVAYGVLDREASTVRYTCAGHPYPLIVSAEGAVRYLEGGRRSALAAQSLAGPAASAVCRLPAGSLLVLYTDGLVERRGEPLETGLARLAAAAATCAALPVGAVCARIPELMAPPGGYSDDVAVLAVRPAGTTPTSLVRALPADPAQLAPARHELRDWLRTAELGLEPEAVYDVLGSVGEALINAIEHGSGNDARRIISLEVFVDDDEIAATVSDSGRWASDSAASRRASSRGRGLTIIHGMSDSVETVRTLIGTRVTMRHAFHSLTPS